MGKETSRRTIRSSLRRLLTPSGAVAATVMLSIPMKELRERLVDPDLWWHLRTGRLIVETGSIPNVDPYSFTAQGSPWVVQEWGSEVLLHLIREWFGLGGIVAYKAVLLFVIYAIFARLVIRRMGGGMGAWALIGASAYAGAPNWTERPNLLSFLLFVVTLALLERRDARIWWFVPLAALWANLHGMVLLGVGLVAVCAAGEWIRIWLADDGDRAHAIRASLVALAGLGATLLNPAGPRLLGHSISLLSSVRGIVTEWASPDFHAPGPALFLALLLVVIGAIGLQTNRVNITDLLLVLSFTFLVMQAVRNLLVSSIVVGLVGASAIPGAIRSLRPDEPRAPSQPSPLISAVAIVCVMGIFAFLIADGAAKGGQDEYIDATYPLAAIDALDRPGVRVFAFDVWSGMVIDRAWPNARVFADLRTDLYGREHMRRYQRTIAARPGWDDTLDEACVTHVLIQPEDPLSQVLSITEGWRTERTDDLSRTFVRTQPPSDC